MSYFEAVILAIVQGITEFLPISSTGHLVVSSSIMRIQHESFTKLFMVAIQLGSILSVVVLYWKRFFQTVHLYYNLFFAFIPAVVMGLLFSEQIDLMLENPTIVGIMLLIGGIFFLFIDKLFPEEKATTKEIPGIKKSIFIGMFQCMALIPGVSRSAATIIGGLTQRMNRKTAAEFSFLLAVPTMFAATAKKSFDFYQEGLVLTSQQVNLLIVGNVVAFIVAMIAIKTFIGFLTRNGFKIFGYYRIAAGIVILVLMIGGFQMNM